MREVKNCMAHPGFKSPSQAVGDSTTLGSFLLHPCSLRVFAAGVDGTAGVPSSSAGNDSPDHHYKGCDIHYQSNDQFVDSMMGVGAVGEGEDDLHSSHPGKNTSVVKTPGEQACPMPFRILVSLTH
jgi:hypothetical protein